MSVKIKQILTNIRKSNLTYLMKDNKEQNAFIVTSKHVVSLLFQSYLEYAKN